MAMTMPKLQFVASVFLALSLAASASRIVGGDGVVFNFQGKREKHFCLISDPSLHVNAHFIGKNSHPRPLTWIDGLALIYGGNNLYIRAFPEPTWDQFLDHLEIRFNGEELHLPAPGYKAGPRAEAARWESPDAKTTITRHRVNEARIVVEGLLDLRIKADSVPSDMWTEHDCFSHLDLEFRDLQVSSVVHGVLGQTYRPARLQAAKMRAETAVSSPEKVGAMDAALLGRKRQQAIVGRVSDYLVSGLWTTDCKFSKYSSEPAVAGPTLGAASAGDVALEGPADMAGEQKDLIGLGLGSKGMLRAGGRKIQGKPVKGGDHEEVNPLASYFSETAVRIVRRSRVSGEEDVLVGLKMEAPQVVDEGAVVDIGSVGRGAAVDGKDTDRLIAQLPMVRLFNE
eukprot:jgi/Mesen1/2276/ME000154S01448